MFWLNCHCHAANSIRYSGALTLRGICSMQDWHTAYTVGARQKTAGLSQIHSPAHYLSQHHWAANTTRLWQPKCAVSWARWKFHASEVATMQLWKWECILPSQEKNVLPGTAEDSAVIHPCYNTTVTSCLDWSLKGRRLRGHWQPLFWEMPVSGFVSVTFHFWQPQSTCLRAASHCCCVQKVTVFAHKLISSLEPRSHLKSPDTFSPIKASP